MNFEYTQTICAGMLFLSSISISLYMALKIRALSECRRESNSAFVTHSHLEKVRREFMRTISDAACDLRTLRAQIGRDYRLMQSQYSASLAEMRELICKNAQSISALAAQSELANQRICELSLKTDKLALNSSKERAQ